MQAKYLKTWFLAGYVMYWKPIYDLNFYRDLQIMSKQQTFGALITFIERSPIMFQDDANRGQIISNLSLINSVFFMETTSWRPISKFRNIVYKSNYNERCRVS